MDMPLVFPLMSQVIIIFITLLIGAAAGLLLRKGPLRFSRKAWLFIWLIPLSVLLYLVFYVACNMIWRKQVETQLEKMKQSGIPASIWKFLPERINSPDNGTFFYRAAFDIMYDSEAFRKVNDTIIKKSYSNDVSSWADEDKVLAQKLLLTQKEKRVFELIKEGNEKPFAVYNRDYNNLDAYLGDTTKQRNFFRRLAVMASCQAAAGNLSEAYDLINNGFIMIGKQGKDPFYVMPLVNIVCTMINLGPLDSLVKKYGISDTDAKKIINSLDSIDFNKTFSNVIDFEIYMNWIKIKNAAAMSLSPFIYYDYSYYIDYSQRAKALFAEPYYLAKEKIRNMKNELQKQPLLHYSFGYCNGILVYREKSSEAETEIDAAKIMLALHIYKNNHGEFPGKLDVLAPEILKEIPLDPFNGKPFEYNKNGDYFRLSSEWLAEKEKISKKNRR